MISPVVDKLSQEYADESVTFYKVHCGAARRQHTHLQRNKIGFPLTARPQPLTHGCSRTLQVDIDREAVQASVREAGVASVPTFSFYRGGKMIATFSGADRRQLENNLVNLVSLGG